MTGSFERRAREAYPEIEAAAVDFVGMLTDVQREAVWQHLKMLAYDIKWVSEADFESFRGDGWKPVQDRRGKGRTVFYMDRGGGLLLMFKAPARFAADVYADAEEGD